VSKRKPDDPVITPEEAQEALQAARSARVVACQAAIQAVLTEHRCDLLPNITIRATQVIPEIVIVAKD
jgi:hypothetical protein